MTRGQKAYQAFLRTDFWKALSRQKRELVPACERCSSQTMLQSHHHRYPADWFDTTLEDLMVLCRRCHRREHLGIIQIKPVNDQLGPNGRPWDQEYMLDLAERFFGQFYYGICLKRSHIRLLRNLARYFYPERCLMFKIRLLFRNNHFMMNDKDNRKRWDDYITARRRGYR